MTGLDKMISQILEEAQSLAKEREEKAVREAEAIREEAAQETAKQIEAIAQKAEKDVKDYQSRLKSADEQKRRTALLAAKQEIIAEVIEEAYRKFCSMESKDYFATIRTMLEKYVLPQEGEILFSRKDLENMPKDFPEVIARTAKEKGGSLTISKETRNMDGGFVLLYNGIEENCSFRAIFDAKRDELQDRVHKVLFF